MKNNDIGFLFKINNVCNAAQKADIYLVPGSKETGRQAANGGASLLRPACAAGRRGARWLGVDCTVRIKAKAHHHYCYLLPVEELQSSQGKKKIYFSSWPGCLPKGEGAQQ